MLLEAVSVRDNRRVFVNTSLVVTALPEESRAYGRVLHLTTLAGRGTDPDLTVLDGDGTVLNRLKNALGAG